MTRLHVRVLGRVQGVYFRVAAQREAEQLGLRGWVRNVRDGSVEAVAEGEEAQVARFLAWCRRGPPAAAVVEVEATTSSPTDLPEGFHVRPTV